jgi:hypothetical protein
MSPGSLREAFNNSGQVSASLGNFGHIQYGVSRTGHIFYPDSNKHGCKEFSRSDFKE